jgi:hypothetical protein
MLAIRNYPLVLASGVAVLLSSLVGAAAISGALPRTPGPEATLDRTASAAAAKRAARCGTCGFIQSVRAMTLSGAGGRKVYRVTVRMDDGAERTLSRTSVPGFGVGTRVRINGNALERG